jgi:hypothetical protein
LTPDRNSRSTTKPAEGGFHARDLRLAGGISAALVSAILVGGALLAPVADWDGLSSAPPGDDDSHVLRLAEAAPAPASQPRDSRPDSSPGPVLTVPGPDGPVAVNPAGLTGGTPVSLPIGGSGGDDDAQDRSDRKRPRPVTGSTANDGGAIDDPATNDLTVDSDGDGILDQNWRAYNMDPRTNPYGDDDNDGVLNKDELTLRTAPNSATTYNGEHDSEQLKKDSDGDGLRNGVEIKNGTKPFEQDSNNNGLLDGDTNGDGVVDDNDDFDGDGHSNGTEAAAGTDPDDPASFPVPPEETPDQNPPPPTDEDAPTNPALIPDEDDTPDDDADQLPTPDDEPAEQPEDDPPAEVAPAPAADAPAAAAPAPVEEAPPAPAPVAEEPAPAAAAAPEPAPAAAAAPEPAPAAAAAAPAEPAPAPAPAVAPPPPPPPPAAAPAAAAAPAPAAPEAPAPPPAQ